MKPLLQLAQDLAAGRTTSRALTEEALAKAADPAGEGSRVFIKLHHDGALAAAEAADRVRKAGIALSPIAGLPISVKDLFDEKGEVTLAASKALADNPPAKEDSVVVARLRRAGAVIVGRTNLTEFAYSGLGINPHYGTPKNPWDRKVGRVPGGSSAGAAVSVTDGMAAGAIGTDTGGSVRIPAAVCGITGFKTTTKRISLDGCFPLSFTLDSAGPLAPSVACCALLDQVMRGATPVVPAPLPLDGLRFAVPKTLVLDELDREVAAAFQATLTRLSKAGAKITEIPLAELAESVKISIHGGILGAEAFSIHRKLIETKGNLYDPRVRVRIQRGQNLSAADYIDIVRARADIQARVNAATSAFDAMLMPTTAIVAPRIDELIASEEMYARINPLILRNTTTGNFLDRCALTLPCHEPGTAPVGLMIVDQTGADEHLVRVGLAVEPVVRRG